MSSWKDISLFKYQQIELINSTPRYDEMDRILFSVCAVFDMTEAELNAKKGKQAIRLIKKMSSVLANPLAPKAARRIGPYRMAYDVSSFTLAQYVELEYFFKQTVKNAHYILASCSRRWHRKYSTVGHRRRADYFSSIPVEVAIGTIQLIKERFEALNREYAFLFGLDNEAHTNEAKSDRFNQRYGWTYSVSAVAEYERITLDEAYGLPVRRAFNDLAFLKEKVKYEIRERDRLMEQFKQNRHG